MAKMYKATLVKGQTYTFGNTKFEQRRPRLVPARVKEHLEENALERVIISTTADNGEPIKEVEWRPKFTFAAVQPAAPETSDDDEADDDDIVGQDVRPAVVAEPDDFPEADAPDVVDGAVDAEPAPEVDDDPGPQPMKPNPKPRTRSTGKPAGRGVKS